MIDSKYLLIGCHVAAVAIDETMLQVHYGTKTENFKRYSACTAQDTLSALCTVSSCWVAAIVMALALSESAMRPDSGLRDRLVSAHWVARMPCLRTAGSVLVSHAWNCFSVLNWGVEN